MNDPTTANTRQRYDVLVVGSVNTDLVLPVPALPQAGETVLGGDVRRIGGGKGANQAVAAARLGAGAAFLGCVGGDALGAERVAELDSCGVTVDAVVTDPARPTGAALILVDEGGENVIAVSPGANAALTPSHVTSASTLFAQASVLVCQLEVPLNTVQAALDEARAHNVTTILNAAPGTPEAAHLLSSTDVLIVNRIEAASLTGHPIEAVSAAHAAATELSEEVQRAAILTLGAEGSIIASHSGVAHVPAWRVDPVDATAAGDAFVGAIAVALSRGEALADAARFATAAAALAVGRFGAQSSLPTAQEVAAFLRKPPVAAYTESCHDGEGTNT